MITTELATCTTHSGRRIGWTQLGDPEGRPMLFLHGTPGGRLAAVGGDEAFIDRGLCVLSPDRPGYGATDPSPGRSVVDFASDLVAIMDAQGWERASVVGGSGGGPYALGFAAQHPDRVASVGVLVGAVPLLAEEVEQQVGLNQKVMAVVDDEPRLRELLTVLRATLLEQGLGVVLPDIADEDRELFERRREVTERALRSALEPGIEGLVEDYRALWGKPWGFDPGEVRAPVVWAHGTADRNVPLSAALRYAADLPECRIINWDGVGHAVPVDRQIEFYAALIESEDSSNV